MTPRCDELTAAHFSKLLENKELNPKQRAELLVARGKIFWKEGNLRQALCDYNEAAELDPEGSGKELAENAADVFSFFNPDLYNP